MLRDRFDDVEGLVTVASREQSTEIGVALGRFGKEHGPVRIMDEFCTKDRVKSGRSGDVEKADRAIEAVAIRERQRLVTVTADGVAKRLQRGNPIHGRVRRMYMEMHEVGWHSLTPPISDDVLSESSMELIECHRESLGAGLSPLFRW